MNQTRTFLTVARRSFPFCFGGIWLLCGLPFLILGIVFVVKEFRLEARFEKEAQTAEGILLTKSRRTNKNSKSYWVSYRFRAADGAVIKNEAQVGADDWERLTERQPIPVKYLPGQPETNRIEAGKTGWLLALIFTALGIFFVPVGGLIFLKGMRGITRDLSLARDGLITAATVTEVSESDVSFNGVPQWRIRYRYHDQRGRPHLGESGPMPPEEAHAWQVGDQGSVRFDWRAPKKSIWIGKS
jgi:hypothetical protein